MDDWKKKLQDEIARQGRNMKEVSLAAKLGETYVRDALMRDRIPKIENRRKLAEALGKEPGWLDSEPVPKPKLVSSFDPDDDDGNQDSDAPISKASDGKSFKLTPGAIAEIDVRAGAGGGGFAAGAVISDGQATYAADVVRSEWLLPKTFVRDELHLSVGRAEIVQIRGDSMEPDLRDGDRVIVDRTDVNLRQGGIFAVLDGGELIVKQVELVRGTDPAQIVCTSRNQNYSPVTLTLDDGTVVIGRVAARISRM